MGEAVEAEGPQINLHRWSVYTKNELTNFRVANSCNIAILVLAIHGENLFLPHSGHRRLATGQIFWSDGARSA